MAETQVVVPEHITTEKTDRRGRFTLGSDFKNKRVKVAVLDVEEIGDGDEQ